MSQGETQRITQELLGEPHIRGRRISVRQVYALVRERGEDPETVADRFDLDVADIYHALAYYHDNPAEMQSVSRERTETFETFEQAVERPDGIEPTVE